MTAPSTYWNGDVLMHHWYGASLADEIGRIKPNRSPHKAQPLVFEADTNDDVFVRYYYEKPTAEEVLSAFLNWQARA